MELQQLRDNVKPLMKDSRYQHTLGTEAVAYDLALIHGYDTIKASIAGILHDCAKDLSDEELLHECVRLKLPVTEIEKQRALLLHAKVGAAYAGEKFGIRDEEILNAIAYHTTGKPGMTLLEKIIFTADYIEPNRKPLPNIDVIRQTAYNNLDQAITMISKSTLDYLESTGAAIDTLTRDTYEYYKQLTQSNT
jgi:nicotinate-nucleotide adenylyltransferase